ncbi:CbrC family protein [Streptomyces werraensis]|uniref:CbrC family protein n=1 Tax=Streptomyces werraensis TaxID=68284 RepID=UPI0037CD8F47
MPIATSLDRRRARGQTAAHETDRVPAMSDGLPYFRYHPDPVATGSIRVSADRCVCCDRSRGWIYTATFYTEHDIDGPFCPWCIADGSAAERFEGDFTDCFGLDGVSEDVVHEVTRRTPGFNSWQQPHWSAHCGDAAALVGEVEYAELAKYPEALEQLGDFVTHLGGDVAAVLFRCTVCGSHLAHADFS